LCHTKESVQFHKLHNRKLCIFLLLIPTWYTILQII
jgi:hypothetical protein